MRTFSPFRRDKVHQDARDQNQESARAAGLAKRTLGDRLAILAFHHACAADGQQAQAVSGFPKSMRPEHRPHTNPEFFDFHAAALGGHQMPEFMEHDQQAERQQCQKDAGQVGKNTVHK